MLSLTRFVGALAAANLGLLAQQWGWTLEHVGLPPARAEHAMAFDSVRGRTVLYGGRWTVAWPYTVHHDTWQWDGLLWSQVATTGPSASVGCAMAFDSQRGRAVLFGGYDPSPGSVSQETWEWDGQRWLQVAANGPAARCRHSMIYDRLRGVSVLFGGCDANLSAMGDTWLWNGTTWTRAQVTGPGPR